MAFCWHLEVISSPILSFCQQEQATKSTCTCILQDKCWGCLRPVSAGVGSSGRRWMNNWNVQIQNTYAYTQQVYTYISQWLYIYMLWINMFWEFIWYKLIKTTTSSQIIVFFLLWNIQFIGFNNLWLSIMQILGVKDHLKILELQQEQKYPVSHWQTIVIAVFERIRSVHVRFIKTQALSNISLQNKLETWEMAYCYMREVFFFIFFFFTSNKLLSPNILPLSNLSNAHWWYSQWRKWNLFSIKHHGTHCFTILKPDSCQLTRGIIATPSACFLLRWESLPVQLFSTHSLVMILDWLFRLGTWKLIIMSSYQHVIHQHEKDEESPAKAAKEMEIVWQNCMAAIHSFPSRLDLWRDAGVSLSGWPLHLCSSPRWSWLSFFSE